ncbi:unnamed protein product [Nezara viridula]|uniref:Uncharacterized protein n=1 Tax=Nezara viridula TaxID=85310 RepID=A0A9P0MPU6_NEZVI|nr:unnamed protein product [Nezara viridula]
MLLTVENGVAEWRWMQGGCPEGVKLEPAAPTPSWPGMTRMTGLLSVLTAPFYPIYDSPKLLLSNGPSSADLKCSSDSSRGGRRRPTGGFNHASLQAVSLLITDQLTRGRRE